jgi:DNA-binding IscR family transcriptional regulator
MLERQAEYRPAAAGVDVANAMARLADAGIVSSVSGLRLWTLRREPAREVFAELRHHNPPVSPFEVRLFADQECICFQHCETEQQARELSNSFREVFCKTGWADGDAV